MKRERITRGLSGLCIKVHQQRVKEKIKKQSCVFLFCMVHKKVAANHRKFAAMHNNQTAKRV